MIQKESLSTRYKFSRGATWFFLLATILLLGYTFYRSEMILGGWHSEGNILCFITLILRGDDSVIVRWDIPSKYKVFQERLRMDLISIVCG